MIQIFIVLIDHYILMMFLPSAINKAGIKDTEMDAIMDTIVNSLFSFMVTMGTVPIIRCPRGNAAEMVAEVCQNCLFIFNG